MVDEERMEILYQRIKCTEEVDPKDIKEKLKENIVSIYYAMDKLEGDLSYIMQEKVSEVKEYITLLEKDNERFNNELDLDYVDNNFVSKEHLKKFFSERLVKYNEADDGKYNKPYLTRGELELVDRYGECKDIAEILLKEKIELPKECISKDKIRDKIKDIEMQIKGEKSNRYTIPECLIIVQVLKSIIGE